jgi:hypothetical protein
VCDGGTQGVQEDVNRIEVSGVNDSYDEQSDFNTGAAVSQPKGRSSLFELESSKVKQTYFGVREREPGNNAPATMYGEKRLYPLVSTRGEWA